MPSVLEEGHLAKISKGVDRVELHRNCGGGGHQAKVWGIHLAAQDYAWAEASKDQDDLIIVLEPNRKLCSTGSWITELDIVVALWVNKGMEVENVQRRSGYVRIQLAAEIRRYLWEARKCRDRALIVGDINAMSPQWDPLLLIRGVPMSRIR
ncbi:hypothetical protein WA026_020971 [Henosepilachna vigintioctopunctata]|uniref:Endonuclease/exonuclease/phosphatase domain-containing protein n=1 Tax=Henosepilachna vigintioctopunctata TaxID=420089 RepID=A0AAW1VJ70_9CUCU